MVVFPLLPVIQIVLAVLYLPANSISDITGMFFSFIDLMKGMVSGIPGLLITSFEDSIIASSCFPS